MARNGDTVQLSGVIDAARQRFPETGFAILRLKVDSQYENYSFVHPGTKMCTLIGALAAVPIGVQVTVNGTYICDRRYGDQVQVENITVSQPKRQADIERYLSSEVKLIGKKLARQIVEHFGDNTIEVLDTTPERLSEISGLGAKRQEQIRETWVERRELRNLHILCGSLGVTPNMIEKIVRQYNGPQAAIDIIREDPYRLARDVWGIGFSKADEIATKMGIEELNPVRIRALLFHHLDEGAQNDGHVFMWEPDLVTKCVQTNPQRLIDPTLVQQVLNETMLSGKLQVDGQKVYQPEMYRAERQVASGLRRVLEHPLPQSLQGDGLLQCFAQAEQSSAVPLAEQQRHAVYAALATKVFALTGGPGTGKTTITKCIVAGFEHAQQRVTLLAPTGAAAKRMRQVIGRPAETVHRLLNRLEVTMKRYPDTEPDELLLRGAVVLDEWSMADLPLMAWLLKWIHPSASIVIVGDKDQLPSVGCGAVLRDVMNSNVIPCIHLTEIFRQAAASNIITNAHRINAGYMPVLAPVMAGQPFPSDDMVTWCTTGDESMLNATLWSVTALAQSLGLNPLTEVQVLSPRQTGSTGVGNLNLILQRALNPTPPVWIERGQGVVWAVGDRVLQRKNDYRLNVFNGEQGIITELALDPDNKLQKVTVQYDEQAVEYRAPMEWNNLILSYATTIHKSQGSEWPMVIVLIDSAHGLMLQRNLLYTGITRGRRKVVLIYDSVALSRSINNVSMNRRNTFLAERLAAGV